MSPVDFQSQFKKLQQKRELLVILLFLLVIIVFWIGLGVFSSQQTSGTTTEQSALAAPLNPNLNISVIEGLEQKQVYSMQELSAFPIRVTQPLGVQTEEAATTEVQAPQITLPGALENQLESLEESF